jgi:hypothetical protein
LDCQLWGEIKRVTRKVDVLESGKNRKACVILEFVAGRRKIAERRKPRKTSKRFKATRINGKRPKMLEKWQFAITKRVSGERE